MRRPPTSPLALLCLLLACACAREAADAAPSVWEQARQRGALFRATGNEPGWSLEIGPGGQARFVTDYGQTRVEAALGEPLREPEASRTTYRARTDAHALELVIERVPCRDGMSGEAFESRVRVVLDGREHRGCGRDLQ